LQQSRKAKKGISHASSYKQRKHALELGSGPGLAGMAAALLGWHTTLTDVADVLPLLRDNVQRNFSGRQWLDSVSLRERFGGIQVTLFSLMYCGALELECRASQAAECLYDNKPFMSAYREWCSVQ
jgi:Lysine methyltransferase